MCGRFVLHHDITELQSDIEFTTDMDGINPNFNIAPTKPILAIIKCPYQSSIKLDIFQWGLVPSWAKDPTWSAKMINARSETINKKPSFRTAYKRRRCLIPASGYYEWKLEGNLKAPYYVHTHNKRPMFFAGLWEIWHDPNGSELYTCTIATVTASQELSDLHNRMPVILKEPARKKWLETDEEEAATLLNYLVPYESGDMKFYRVSNAVNKASWNNPQAIEPMED
tara:strand:+ start:9016 stop:9693 length:678 start_codon:yes stop_codon:yes gene_type:complete